MIDKIALLHFVVSPMNTPAQFRQQHHAQVVVFQIYRLIATQRFFTTQGVNNAIGINRTGRSLIDAVFQEHRVRILLARAVSG
ncbi:hypothetical protein D3C78_1296200 [compost metagenome]